MRIAFQYFGSKRWGGGDFFLESMLRGLRALGADCPTLFLVAGPAAAEADYRDVAVHVDEVLRIPRPGPSHTTLLQQSLRYHMASWAKRRLLHRPPPGEPDLLSPVLVHNKVDVYFAMARSETRSLQVPSVSWLPDFQHLHLPGMFSPEEQAERNGVFHSHASTATRIMVTAADVAADLQAFAPEQAGKVCVVPFAAYIPPETYAEDPRESLARYHLPEKFIYLPNQFWQHKNHKLVFEALAHLRERGVHPCIVCTGNPLDYRQPEFFSELMQLMSRADVRDQVIILGHVPRHDVFQLIRQSVCVLNPSKFEGLGMSLAESRSIGKAVLASDLGPLREQAVPGAVYFDPANACDLAAKLETAWDTLPPGPSLQLEAAARATLPQRQAQFGLALLELFAATHANFTRAQAPNGQGL